MTGNADIDVAADRLTDQFVHQKELILARSGVSRHLDVDRLRSLTRPKMDKMARIVVEWDIDIPLIMEAVFAYARKNRHVDGPMFNMLGSIPYLTKALGYHLGIPYEAVQDLQDREVVFRDLDKSYEDFLIRHSDSDINLVFASSIPVEHRYLLALHRMDFRALVQLSPQLLENMSSDRLLTLWMQRKNLPIERIAKIFNDRKNAHQP